MQHDEGGSGGKVVRVRRQLLYLYAIDRLVVFDEVVSTRRQYTKKWLLHAVDKPVVRNARILVGTSDNGILESTVDQGLLRNGDAFLQLQVLQPVDTLIRLVGGPDYRFYVETDGDDRILNGKNYEAGSSLQPWFDNGFWRLEIQPHDAKESDQFLVVMSPGIGKPRLQRARALHIDDDSARALVIEGGAVVFAQPRRGEPLELDLPDDVRRVLFTGLLPHAQVEVVQSGKKYDASAGEGGGGVNRVGRKRPVFAGNLATMKEAAVSKDDVARREEMQMIAQGGPVRLVFEKCEGSPPIV